MEVEVDNEKTQVFVLAVNLTICNKLDGLAWRGVNIIRTKWLSNVYYAIKSTIPFM